MGLGNAEKSFCPDMPLSETMKFQTALNGDALSNFFLQFENCDHEIEGNDCETDLSIVKNQINEMKVTMYTYFLIPNANNELSRASANL